MSPTLADRLFPELLRGTHHYRPGIEHRHPTLVPGGSRSTSRTVRATRERVRDAVERAARVLGFARCHFDSETAAARLARILAMLPGLEQTYGDLADEQSRRALVDLLKFRLLGPFHASLAVSAQEFRDKQRFCDSEFLVSSGTFVVSDPWFSPLSLYRIPSIGRDQIELNAHSVDLVSVYLLGQYRYRSGAEQVGAHPGDVVLDVGGCWGDTALYFADQVGPTGKVYTFEFDPESLAILRANLDLNPKLADRVEIVEAALWDASGEHLAFTQAGRCTTIRKDSASVANERQLAATTVTMDDFVRDAGLDRVDFIKMDVEGAERRVLRGAQRTLREHGPSLAVAAYHQDDDLVALPGQLRACGADYRLFIASYSPVEDETVLFAKARSRSSST